MSSRTVLPCLDSQEMAEQRRQELDIPWSTAKALGLSAVVAAREGHYQGPSGEAVNWQGSVSAACATKQSICPDAELPPPPRRAALETRTQVSNETTLGAAHRLVSAGLQPLALNFANGIHPGGGFLGGARAQEEVLCRSSALYSTLVDDSMYTAHRARPRPDSTDWAILSPDVPVFRTDDGTALDSPWHLSFVTCAAPYAPAFSRAEAAKMLEQRIHRVLAIAHAYGYVTLVLGAWGCGAFGNDPWTTALAFRRGLEELFVGSFSDVVFAITDWSPERRFLGPFRDVFSGDANQTGT